MPDLVSCVQFEKREKHPWRNFSFSKVAYLLLIFKMYIYNARTIGYLNINYLLIHIKGIKDTEKKLCENDAKRRKNSKRN